MTPSDQTKEKGSVCPWCGKGIRPGEPTAVSDGETMHLQCAAEEEDNVFFERDMGFGDG